MEGPALLDEWLILVVARDGRHLVAGSPRRKHAQRCELCSVKTAKCVTEAATDEAGRRGSNLGNGRARTTDHAAP